jgi:hypothetical protein
MRPLQAAIEFVTVCIQRVDKNGDGEGEAPGEPAEFVASDWFRVVFNKTRSWYVARYGTLIDTPSQRTLHGVICVYETPFLLRVPTTTTEPSEPGESFWLCFHDAVRPEEDVLTWLVNGPNFATAPRGDGMKVRRVGTDVANRLRFIYIALMGMKAEDARLLELRDEIVPHLERAAEQIAKGGFDDFKRAHWDMQMACEMPLKSLAQQRAGVFEEKHDLFHLYDRMPGGPPPFSRHFLSKVPNWERMAEWRYAGGGRVSLDATFRHYRATLQIVAETVAAFEKTYQLGRARFKLRRPPWLLDA